MLIKEIDLRKIETIQAAGPYAVIGFEDGTQFVASRSLKYLQRIWPSLVRVNRSHAINPEFACGWRDGQVEVKSGKIYTLSRQKLKILSRKA
jgi:DNA-binding LytR/AlgR family response regulator